MTDVHLLEIHILVRRAAAICGGVTPLSRRIGASRQAIYTWIARQHVPREQHLREMRYIVQVGHPWLPFDRNELRK
jgi:hypothetical protein